MDFCGFERKKTKIEEKRGIRVEPVENYIVMGYAGNVVSMVNRKRKEVFLWNQKFCPGNLRKVLRQY